MIGPEKPIMTGSIGQSWAVFFAVSLFYVLLLAAIGIENLDKPCLPESLLCGPGYFNFWAWILPSFFSTVLTGWFLLFHTRVEFYESAVRVSHKRFVEDYMYSDIVEWWQERGGYEIRFRGREKAVRVSQATRNRKRRLLLWDILNQKVGKESTMQHEKH